MTDRGPTLRIGIAGLAIDATQIIPEIQKRPHMKVVAAMDGRAAAREGFESEFGGRAYDSMEGLCGDAGVDAIYVCTPNRVRAEHGIMVAAHGKQVLMEKPMGLTLDECDRLIQAADQHGVRLLAGHSEGLTAPIEKMGQIVASGELGRPLMINTWHFSEWLYRPRAAEELDASQGGGVMFRQAPHQVDIVRVIGGGRVRSVRASTTAIDPTRPVEGSFVAFLEFEDGTPATIVFSGYAHFDTAELTFGIDSGGRPRKPDAHLTTRALQMRFNRPEEEWAYKESAYYGASEGGSWADSFRGRRNQPMFGLTVLSCEKGDVRQTPDGLKIYADDGWRDLALPKHPLPRGAELELMYEAWASGNPLESHDGRWARATMEVTLGMIASAHQRREVTMSHQVPYQPTLTPWAKGEADVESSDE